MYGYETTIRYMPATEGNVGDAIKSWGKQVLAFIQNCGKRIKEFIMNIVNSIKAKRASKDEALVSSRESVTIVANISNNIKALLDSCIDNIVSLSLAYENTLSHNETNASYKRADIDVHKGMDKLYKKQNGLNSDDIKKWNETKIKLASEFKKNAETAEDMREKLNKLRSMPLTLDALKNGYTELKGIFGKNNKFEREWNVIIMGHDWATGEIRGYLGKVVSMYKMGINATNALGKQLSAKKVRDNEGVYQKNEHASKYQKEKAANLRKIRKEYREMPNSSNDDEFDFDDDEVIIDIDDD